MAEAFVTPHLLTWARQRRGLEVEDLAKKLNVKPDAVNAWEAGERRLTFRQAQNFAQALYVPFGYRVIWQSSGARASSARFPHYTWPAS